MFNGQNPPGGGGNPPQQPPNNPNLQLLAPQLQEALAAITNPQNQAQLLGLLLGLPQQQRQQPQPQQLPHEQLQQIVRLQQQQQQELLLQQEQRNQQQQQLQQQQIQQQQQQLQQILALQQQQELLRRLGAVAQNQQLNPLLAQQIAQQHVANIPAPPATPIVPPAPLSAQPSAQPSPAQRVHVVNSPGILQASNQVMNFINQEENRVQQPQQPPAPPLVQPQVQRPQIATHSNVQIPVVRVQNNSAQVVAPQVHRPQPPPQPRPRHQPQNLPHHQVQHQPQPQPQRQPQPQSLHQPLPPPQRQPLPPPQHQPQPQPLHRPQPQPQHQFQPHPPQEPQRHQQLHQQPRQQPHQQLIQIRPAPPPPPPQQVHPQQQLHVQQQQVEVPREPERLPSPPPPPPRAPAVRARRGRGRGQRRQVEPDNGPPRVDEALSYLRIIKETFVNRVPVYHRFLDIMKNFRAQRIETSEVVEQVAALLYDSPNLVLGFNTFLPTGYKIAMLDGTKYTFTTPDNQTRILLSPQERRQQRMDVGDPEEDELPLPPLEDPADEMDEMQDGNPSDESNEAGVEEEEEQIELPLMEEVIVDRGQADEPEEEVNEVPEDVSAQTLEIVRLVTEAFSARPDRITSFLTFMDMYLSTTKFYIQKKKGGQKMDGGDARDEEMPGPAPPPQQAGPPVDENMEMEEDEEARRRGEAASRDEEALENAHQEHLISHLAEVCLGEPVLLATLIDFLPYLNRLLKNGSEQTAEKIQSILRFKVADNCGIAELADREQVDKKLLKKMESAKMGTKKEEKLVLTKMDESGEGSEEQLMVLQKTYRILYEKLKERTTATQIKHLITLLNMYLKMDLTKEQLVLQLPKVMGGSGTQAEIIILRLLGIDKDEKPENDPDAVTRKDLPPVQPKRGLRDQKQLQHTRTVEAATVCTLGPSYRLMKDSKEAACSGRVELEPEIKETLNDKWTSYPSWSSEETGNQPIKKSNLEEFHFRTEDERYELDIIVDSNRTIMEELEKTLTDIEAMSDAERRAFQLNDSLNCTSRATFLRVMTKIYTNSVPELVAAAKEKPIVGLKKIIEGLQEKDAAWTRFQQDANRAWRDALDKQMTTSLSLMNNQQKNYDQKAFKSKPLVSAIEQIFEDRKKSGADDKEAHMSLDFTPEGKVYQDVNDVTSHFFQDLGGKGDKDRTKVVLLRVLMEWLCREQDNAKLDSDAEEVFKSNRDSMEDDMDTRRTRSDRVSPLPTSSSQESSENAAEKFTKSLHRRERRVFYGDDNVYLVIRFYHMIQERFAKLLTSQANYTQEYDDNAKKQKKWQEGVGARSHGRLTLSEYVKTQQEAVDDIRNVRACPSAFYTTALRELKQLGSAQTDIGAFEDAIKNLFPGDAALFNNIDKLFSSLAKNIHHAACADDAENAVKLYLKFRRRLMDAKSKEERDSVEEEYLQAAEEVLRGRNKYRFEFVAESNAPHMNIWVMPREEKESEDDDEDEDGNEGGNEDKDDNKDKNEVEGEDDQDPTGNDEAEENDDDEEDNESDESPSGGEGSGGQAGDVEMED